MRLPLKILCLGLYFYIVCSLECSSFDTRMGAIFDLSSLVRRMDQPSYSIIDGDIPCTETIEPNFTYYFNICGNLGSDDVPNICKAQKDFSTASSVRLDNNIDPNQRQCEITGLYSDLTSELQLITPEDPTKGLVMTYYGDYCENPRTQKKFIINLNCADILNPVPTHAYEYKHCEYTISMPSVHGCPIQCPISQRRLCAGNGYCAYDNDAATARCFCNKGYYGTDCQHTQDISSMIASTFSPILLSLIITLLVVITALIGGITVLYRQLNGYQADVENYRALQATAGAGSASNTELTNGFSVLRGRDHLRDDDDDSFNVIE